MNSTRISCSYLGDLYAEAIHSLSRSVIYTDATKDYDWNGKDLASLIYQHLLWELEEINIIVYKRMNSKDPMKIKSLVLEIFMPYQLDSYRFKVLQSINEEYPVKLNLEDSIDIQLNWHQ